MSSSREVPARLRGYPRLLQSRHILCSHPCKISAECVFLLMTVFSAGLLNFVFIEVGIDGFRNLMVLLSKWNMNSIQATKSLMMSAAMTKKRNTVTPSCVVRERLVRDIGSWPFSSLRKEGGCIRASVPAIPYAKPPRRRIQVRNALISRHAQKSKLGLGNR